jgi:hypothetical protein
MFKSERDVEDLILNDLVKFTEFFTGVPAVKNYKSIKQLFDSIEENL